MTNPILIEINRLVPGYELSPDQMAEIETSKNPPLTASVFEARLRDAQGDAARYLSIPQDAITLAEAMSTLRELGEPRSGSGGMDKEFARRLGLKTILAIGQRMAQTSDAIEQLYLKHKRETSDPVGKAFWNDIATDLIEPMFVKSL